MLLVVARRSFVVVGCCWLLMVGCWILFFVRICCLGECCVSLCVCVTFVVGCWSLVALRCLSCVVCCVVCSVCCVVRLCLLGVAWCVICCLLMVGRSSLSAVCCWSTGIRCRGDVCL